MKRKEKGLNTKNGSAPFVRYKASFSSETSKSTFIIKTRIICLLQYCLCISCILRLQLLLVFLIQVFIDETCLKPPDSVLPALGGFTFSFNDLYGEGRTVQIIYITNRGQCVFSIFTMSFYFPRKSPSLPSSNSPQELRMPLLSSKPIEHKCLIY